VLVADRLVIKIADFGLTRVVDASGDFYKQRNDVSSHDCVTIVVNHGVPWWSVLDQLVSPAERCRPKPNKDGHTP